MTNEKLIIRTLATLVNCLSSIYSDRPDIHEKLESQFRELLESEDVWSSE